MDIVEAFEDTAEAGLLIHRRARDRSPVGPAAQANLARRSSSRVGEAALRYLWQ